MTGLPLRLVALTAATVLVATACSSTTDTARYAPTCVVGGGGTPVTAEPGTGADGAPEVATGYRSGMTAVRTATYAVSTANPVSTEAACEVLRDGGTAADALVAAQTVLGLVEPQSSGLGGGAFLLYYDAESKNLQAYDGRETAPASATENYLRFVDDAAAPGAPANLSAPLPDARGSGRSIGVPGVVRMLDDVHRDYGDKDWKSLFDPAITLSDNGFEISPRMASSIADSAQKLALDPASAAYFLEPDGAPKAVGTVLTNPAMAKTLGAIATDGADAFYTGTIARSIVDATADTTGGRTPGRITLDDLAAYEARERDAICTPYRDNDICGMPGPSSGGIAVASTMGILSNFDMAKYAPTTLDADGGVPTAEGVHLIAEAERLAYADRDKYVADPDYIPLPGGSPDPLLDPDYLEQRAKSIDPERSMGTAQPGDFGPVPLSSYAGPEAGTSHISVADSYGNVAAMTTTVESAFGSFHMTEGFVLNNQLTDFSAQPAGPDGVPVANRVEPGKRPRSSMAPTIVFERGDDGSRGDVRLVTGSPGGSVIIQFVVKNLVSMLDWGLDPQQAVSAPNVGAANAPTTNVGGEHPNIDAAADGAADPLVTQLRAMGHQVSVADQSSGSSALVRTDDGWTGGADPRREGVVMGDGVG
ncbi:gamma-glutamyltransferase [Rhodococcus sp. Leaf7]|uniref:gamma-glutamyltransferase n=1 Tax=unclassified Rhodococcus (in: high G+C Gram-positive bacteria) TaxID=192944 RepID=UPI0006FB100D|nr:MULTISPECIES: gamma-glutamyltransferase [unclassified Rhodococcus (in: high G+C Gram-positive bacteria)]KQU03329.1 gamma-glutamyltransferase [Rhodococcus sp. Leaf7]KQU39030.1 gamma-glutamyltransferase [Rhodococcus sp. Leaf247]